MEIRGITWDHERGYSPMVAASAEFGKLHPNVNITWEKRSLKDFGDYPVSRLVDDYDLIVVDHPFMPEAYGQELLLDLKKIINPSVFKHLEQEAVGKSLQSYRIGGKVLALPIDVACEVASVNREFFRTHSLEVPKTVEDIFALKEALPEGHGIGLPLWPTDLTCIFLNFVAQQAGEGYFDLEKGIDPKQGAAAADLVEKLWRISQPGAFDMSPIDVYEAMSSAESIVYCPYGFGYTNYSRDGYRKLLLEFHDAPLISLNAQVSTVLGGVGIGISSRIFAEKVPNAAEYIKYVTSASVQKGLYTQNSGQPAALSAWQDEKNNALTHQFFKNTMKTHQTAFIRPATEQWPYFHTVAGEQLQRDLLHHASPEKIAANFNDLYLEVCGAENKK